MTDKDLRPWGRFATLALGFVAMLAGQFIALLALVKFYGSPLGELPNIGSNGVAVTLVIAASTPVQVFLLFVFASWRGGNAAEYLGLTLPKRSEVQFGIIAIVALIVVGDVVSWLLGQDVVTPFQSDIYRTASETGWLPWLWLAVSVGAPIGEETLFRGFLFRGWHRSPGDVWPAIVVVSLAWALIHVQYDWYVIGWVFLSGLLLGWLRWVTGSTMLTILLHGMLNFESMLESFVAYHG